MGSAIVRGGRFFFVKGDEVIPFKEKDITGVVVVKGTDYTQNGKWSHTTYRLQLADDIRHIAGHNGWETCRFAEGLGTAVRCKTPDTWVETAKALGVSVPSAMQFLRSWRPKAAEKLDEVEQALAKLEEASGQETDSVIVTVSFGSPTSRDEADGFWERPKRIREFPPAEIRLIDPEAGWKEGNVTVVGISGTVLTVKQGDGMHGGYYAVSVGVIPGTESEIPPFQTAREKAADESDLPKDLFHAFDGDMERVREFVAKVAALPAALLDYHTLKECGRAKVKAHLESVSGDSGFFLGSDPNQVVTYVVSQHFG
ncbi:MAG: hypothetical protein WC768_03145 [Patescibacteria group bacterium]|jgi:hypothetical protein